MLLEKKNFQILTAPPILIATAKNFDKVKRSPTDDDGKIAAKPNVKRLDNELNNVTNAVSLGSKAN